MSFKSSLFGKSSFGFNSSSGGVGSGNSFSPSRAAQQPRSPWSSSRPLSESDSHNKHNSYDVEYDVGPNVSNYNRIGMNSAGGGASGRARLIESLVNSPRPLKALSDAINRDNTAVDLHLTYMNLLSQETTQCLALLQHIFNFADLFVNDLSFWTSVDTLLVSIESKCTGKK